MKAVCRCREEEVLTHRPNGGTTRVTSGIAAATLVFPRRQGELWQRAAHELGRSVGAALGRSPRRRSQPSPRRLRSGSDSAATMAAMFLMPLVFLVLSRAVVGMLGPSWCSPLQGQCPSLSAPDV